MTKNALRAQRRWPQTKNYVDPDRDYYTGRPLDGKWIGAPSIEPTKDKPICGGPQHRVMQFDTGRRFAASSN